MASTTFRMTTCLLSLVLTSHVTTDASVPKRDRRSDDSDPLEAVVSGLSQTVSQLTAQLQAQGAQISALDTRVGASDQPVAFTVTHSTTDIHGLGSHQTVKFDKVLYNVGSGYNHTSGIFTAPYAGTYVFFVHVMRHGDGETVQLDLYKGSTRLVVAYGCCSTYNSGSNLATVHLNKGETVHVQIDAGTMLWGVHTSFSGFRLSPL